MKNFKFTGVNIAAALLILAYFFPWFSAIGSLSLSGFSITTNGISPGMLGIFLKGFDRLLMVLIAIIPLSGCIILYQNVTGNHKFGKYYKPAHLAPAAVIIAGLVMLYFKMKPDVPDFSNEDLGYGEAMKNMPSIPPLSAILSLDVTHDEGSEISNSPKNDKANTTKITKNATLNHGFVLNSFKIVGPKKLVSSRPIPT